MRPVRRPGNATLGVAAFEDCTATETVNGGASSVAYQCASTPPGDSDATCSTDGTTISFVDTSSASATLTVVNTFAETPPPTTAPPVTPPAVAPAAVAATPTFTG